MVNESREEINLIDQYNLEPKVIEKGEILILGVEDLYVNGISANTKENMIGIYRLLSKKCKEYYDEVMKIAKTPSTTIGINSPSNNSKSYSPIFEFDDGKPDEFYHMVGIEVNTLEFIPEGMISKVLPPSRYVVFSCEAIKDPITNKTHKVNWGPLFSEGYKKFRAEGCLGYTEKGYSIEVAYRSDGKTIDKFDLLIAVE